MSEPVWREHPIMHGVASRGLTREGAQHLGLVNARCRRLFGTCVARCREIVAWLGLTDWAEDIDATSSLPISQYRTITTPLEVSVEIV
jgi:hypothetical protein